jgi:pseudaminic acid biosynthesis-associated methylase
MADSRDKEGARLEALWSGEFGQAYVERNLDAGADREPFWAERVSALGFESCLEVGCNVGANLQWLAELLGVGNVAGVDVNPAALAVLRQRLPGVDARVASGSSLPFDDESFDLTLTTGVLIHVAREELETVMREIVRCARRFVLCGEYHSDDPTEVPYRGQEGALFKRDYGALYQSLCPELALVEKTFLGPDQGWDDVTVWVFEKR